MVDKVINDFPEVPLADQQNFVIQTDAGTYGKTPSEPIKQTVDDVVTLNSDVATLQSDVSTLQTDVADVELLSRNTASTSLISGCELSINGGDPALFDVAAGELQVIDNTSDPENPTITRVSFAGATGESVTNLATQEQTVIGIDSTGTINQFEFTDGDDTRSNAIIGTLYHYSLTQIDDVIDNTGTPAVNIASSVNDLSKIIGIINSDGNVFGPNGSNLNLDKSAGQLFLLGARTKSDIANPNIISLSSLTGLTFTYLWQDGSGGFNRSTGQTEINPANYDDGTGGVGTPNGAVGTFDITTQRIYLLPTNEVLIQYGQDIYASLAEAVDGITTEDFVSAPFLINSIFRSYLITIGTATDLSSPLQVLFINAGKFGDVGLSGASFSTTNLQGAYSNSANPKILTDGTRGALTIRDGTAGAENILDLQNSSSISVVVIKPDGTVNFGNVQSGSGGLSTGDIYHTLGALQIVL